MNALRLIKNTEMVSLLRYYIVQRRGGNLFERFKAHPVESNVLNINEQIAISEIGNEVFWEKDMLAKNLGLKFWAPVDNILIRKAIRMPLEQKLKYGWLKYPLRIAFADILPRQIAWRRDKKGFALPEHDWISKMVREHNLDEIYELSGRMPGKFWRIFNSDLFVKYGSEHQ